MSRVESAIQTDIIGYLRGLAETYVLNYGGSAAGAKGTPDLLVCHRGRFVAFELKKPDGSYKTTKPQEIRIRQIRAAGGVAEVVTAIADVAAVLKRMGEQDA
jgi:hypothetical protein